MRRLAALAVACLGASALGDTVLKQDGGNLGPFSRSGSTARCRVSVDGGNIPTLPLYAALPLALYSDGGNATVYARGLSSITHCTSRLLLDGGTFYCGTEPGTVTAVTASSPIVSSGGTTPNISHHPWTLPVLCDGGACGIIMPNCDGGSALRHDSTVMSCVNFVGSGGGGGVTTMAAVGASPNANGASISGSTLTLQPADGTNPGVCTAVAQTLGGHKTFTHRIGALLPAGVTPQEGVTVDGGLVVSGPLASDNTGLQLYYSKAVQLGQIGSYETGNGYRGMDFGASSMTLRIGKDLPANPLATRVAIGDAGVDITGRLRVSGLSTGPSSTAFPLDVQHVTGSRMFFANGGSATNPSFSVDSPSGKILTLLAGGGGVGVIFDSTATFYILSDAAATLRAGTSTGGTPLMSLTGAAFGLTSTNSTGSPGAATINKPTGRSSVAAGASSMVVTNSGVAATNQVLVTSVNASEDATCTRLRVTAIAAGSFTVSCNAAATAAVVFSWFTTTAL